MLLLRCRIVRTTGGFFRPEVGEQPDQDNHSTQSRRSVCRQIQSCRRQEGERRAIVVADPQDDHDCVAESAGRGSLIQARRANEWVLIRKLTRRRGEHIAIGMERHPEDRQLNETPCRTTGDGQMAGSVLVRRQPVRSSDTWLSTAPTEHSRHT